MNLHNIVGPAIAAVNPWIIGSYQQSNGMTVAADFTQVPAYLPAVTVQVQMQALTYKDLMQLEGINQGGEKRAIYVNGNYKGVSRPDSRGGDLISLPDGTVWLVAQVLENWAYMGGWCKVAVTLQNGS